MTRTGKNEGVTKAAALLGAEGLTLPPIPVALRSSFRARGKWCFSTRALPSRPYDHAYYLEEARTGAAPDYVLVAHDGHGVNSYAMHYYLVQESVALFLQIGWGGIYMDRASSTALVNQSFELAGKLLGAFPEGFRRGKLAAEDRLMVFVSQFRGSFWSVIRPGSPLPEPEEARDPCEVLRKVLHWALTL
jgi:hypothetical protein